MKKILSRTELEELLPHLPEAIKLDEAICYLEENVVEAKWKIPTDYKEAIEHFPLDPMIPGVLIIEAMAQAGSVLMYLTIPNGLLKLVSIKEAKFKRAIRPGTDTKIIVEIVSRKMNFVFAKKMSR